ncbi:MAG: hypothetical protein DRO98_04970, partial [Archaeoglobales archaeon]
IIFQISAKKTPQEAKAWVDEVLERVFEAAEGVGERGWIKPDAFLENVYSMIIFQISAKKTPQEAKAWVDEVLERAEKANLDMPLFFTAVLFHLRESSYQWRKFAVKEFVEKALACMSKDPDTVPKFMLETLVLAVENKDEEISEIILNTERFNLISVLTEFCRMLVENEELRSKFRAIRIDEEALSVLSSAAAMDDYVWKEWLKHFRI